MIKHYLILSLFSCLAFTSYSQQYFEIIDNDSTEKNQERAEMHIDILKDVPFDNVVDIGSGDLRFILKIADHYNTKSFVVEDIDSTKCNRRKMKFMLDFLHLEKVDTNKITIQIGEMYNTLLPDNSCDLVIMAGLMHELNNVDSMMLEIKRILNDDGKLLISDALYETKPEPHSGCDNPYLTKAEFEQEINSLPLEIVKDWKRSKVTSISNGPYESRIILCTFK